MSLVAVPPTFAEVILFDADGKNPRFNPIWLKWFVDLTGLLNASGGTTPGNVVGPVTATADYYAIFDGTTGRAIKVGGNPAAVNAATLLTNTWAAPAAIGSGTPAAGTFTTVKATSVGGYKSSDNSSGYTGTVTTASLVGKTLTIKDGIVTGFA